MDIREIQRVSIVLVVFTVEPKFRFLGRFFKKFNKRQEETIKQKVTMIRVLGIPPRAQLNSENNLLNASTRCIFIYLHA